VRDVSQQKETHQAFPAFELLNYLQKDVLIFFHLETFLEIIVNVLEKRKTGNVFGNLSEFMHF